MKIAIAGAGAMGSRIGLMLHQSGNEVLLIDRWPAHIEAIRTNGLIADFNGKEVVAKLPIYSPEEIIESNEHVDLIVALTKANQLDDMFRSIQSIITDNTYVLCLLNGLGHEDVLEKYVPKKNILFGITMWTAGLAGPGKVTLLGDGEIELENLEPEGEAFTKKVVEVFQEAKEGIILDQEEVYQHIASTYDPDNIGLHYPSMYQDLIKNHRLTEIDYINGAVWRKGQKYDIATPYCAFLTQLVHAKEGILGAE
ncbi:2-dehydropantoate 2-reductase [Enterococcus faecium]|uniref:2-dehydropantoate 2-reductase n=1 Tax=Enterococcus faecium TaxID=1352 RepID=UPI001E2B6894|nr:2-dehydropantoate 2-reductase [Enterococcus faecium]MCD5085154.1 2-dehydropantoate 2-reductase [Enterococcus faecium]